MNTSKIFQSKTNKSQFSTSSDLVRSLQHSLLKVSLYFFLAISGLVSLSLFILLVLNYFKEVKLFYLALSFLTLFSLILILYKKGLLRLSTNLLTSSLLISLLLYLSFDNLNSDIIIVPCLLIIVLTCLFFTTKIASIIASTVIILLSFFTIYYKNQSLFSAQAIGCPLAVLVSAGLFLLICSYLKIILIRLEKKKTEVARLKHQLDDALDKQVNFLNSFGYKKIAQLYHCSELGRLSAGIYHDLLNILSAYSLNLEIQNHRQQKKLPFINQKRNKENIAIAKKLGETMGIIKKYLKQSDAEKLFSPTEEIIQTIKLLKHQLNQAGIKIKLKLNKRLKLYGSSLKFHKIISNLVSNSIDAYSLKDGVEKLIIIELKKVKQHLHLIITDFGQGIAEKDLANIYNIFYSNKPVSGNGIGLYSVKRIIEHDFSGQIEVFSRLNELTKFTVTIPLK